MGRKIYGKKKMGKVNMNCGFPLPLKGRIGGLRYRGKEDGEDMKERDREDDGKDGEEGKDARKSIG